MFLYIHGFRSVGSCHKGSILKGFAPDTLLPNLPYVPRLAINFLEELILENKAKNLCLVGSSLGGFYAMYLAEKYQLKAILINPAIDAVNALYLAIGKMDNAKLCESFLWTLDLVEDLRNFQIKTLTKDLYFVLLQKGDKILDYSITRDFFKDSKILIEEGGSHQFEAFETKKELLLDFMQA